MNGVIAFFIIFVLMIGVAATFVIFLARRKASTYQLFLIADNARNQVFAKPVGYNLRMGKQGTLKAAKLYAHLISIKPKEVHPEIANVSPFIWYGRTLFGVRSPSGDPEDDSIMLLKRPTVSVVDVKNTTTAIQEGIYAKLRSFIEENEGKPLSSTKFLNYIESAITPEWYLQAVGFSKFVNKEDVLPRSVKLAYTNEVEETYNFEKKHAGVWDALAKYAPLLGIAILAIGVGIGVAAAWQQIGLYQHQVYIEQQSLQSYTQSLSLAIGHALAAAHIYGFNATLPSVPSVNTSLSSAIPPFPKT